MRLNFAGPVAAGLYHVKNVSEKNDGRDLTDHHIERAQRSQGPQNILKHCTNSRIPNFYHHHSRKFQEKKFTSKLPNSHNLANKISLNSTTSNKFLRIVLLNANFSPNTMAMHTQDLKPLLTSDRLAHPIRTRASFALLRRFLDSLSDHKFAPRFCTRNRVLDQDSV